MTNSDIISASVANRTLYHSDNLPVLRGMNSQSIDLMYLDPPFNKKDTFVGGSKKVAKIRDFFLKSQKLEHFKGVDFHHIFRDEKASFKDIWSKTDVHDEYYLRVGEHNSRLVDYLNSVRPSAPPGSFYYLLFMAVRLIELHRVLKDTGSLYLHCDPTMSHYLKGLMDKIFGVQNFRNEIVWCYGGRGMSKHWFNRKHDLILFYAKTDKAFFNSLAVARPLDARYIQRYSKMDEEGRRYAKVKNRDGSYSAIYFKETGVLWEDYWNIPFVRGAEAMGYPTQKPLALLERIIKASSREGDIVLDPFCGCATTCIAAERLKRRWLGIDQNIQAYYMAYYRAFHDKKLGRVDRNKNGSLFHACLKLSEAPPRRTDITPEEAAKMAVKKHQKENVKKKKREEMSAEEKEVAKELLYEDQVGMCNGCDVYMRASELTIDHIQPRAEKGEDDLNNLQLLCYRCNNWKRTGTMKSLLDKLLEEGIMSKGTYEKQKKKLY